jgi:hypothetical protein
MAGLVAVRRSDGDLGDFHVPDTDLARLMFQADDLLVLEVLPGLFQS